MSLTSCRHHRHMVGVMFPENSYHINPRSLHPPSNPTHTNTQRNINLRSHLLPVNNHSTSQLILLLNQFVLGISIEMQDIKSDTMSRFTSLKASRRTLVHMPLQMDLWYDF